MTRRGPPALLPLGDGAGRRTRTSRRVSPEARRRSGTRPSTTAARAAGGGPARDWARSSRISSASFGVSQASRVASAGGRGEHGERFALGLQAEVPLVVGDEPADQHRDAEHFQRLFAGDGGQERQVAFRSPSSRSGRRPSPAPRRRRGTPRPRRPGVASRRGRATARSARRRPRAPPPSARKARSTRSAARRTGAGRRAAASRASRGTRRPRRAPGTRRPRPARASARRSSRPWRRVAEPVTQNSAAAPSRRDGRQQRGHVRLDVEVEQRRDAVEVRVSREHANGGHRDVRAHQQPDQQQVQAEQARRIEQQSHAPMEPRRHASLSGNVHTSARASGGRVRTASRNLRHRRMGRRVLDRMRTRAGRGRADLRSGTCS